MKACVLLIPGGRASVHGYFPGLADALEAHATVIEADPPELRSAPDWVRLPLPDYAAALAEVVRRERDGPAVVVAHSFGALVALRLAGDEPGLVAGLLLLDSAPLIVPEPLTGLVGLAAFGRRRRSWLRATSPSLELLLRVWSLARDGATISRDLSAGRFPPIPTIVVSAGVHGPTSLSRRTHERIAASIPDAQLEVWDGTDHSLHVQQPERVRGAVLALLERLSDERRSPSSRS